MPSATAVPQPPAQHAPPLGSFRPSSVRWAAPQPHARQRRGGRRQAQRVHALAAVSPASPASPSPGSTAVDLLARMAMRAVGRLEEMTVDNTGLSGQVIRVPDEFTAQEGVKLLPELIVGSMLGGGYQGAVYKLFKPDGSDPKQLLKVMKFKSLNPVTGLDIGLEREWLIGQQLNKLRTPDGTDIEGFMGTGAALVNESGVFEGLLIDKVNGKPLDKRLWKNTDFAEAEYTIEMLRQVFTALDRGQRELGFVHGDMNIANVMEHTPDDSDSTYLPKGFFKDEKKKKKKGEGRNVQPPAKFILPGDNSAHQLRFKIIDYGHGRLLGGRAQLKLPAAPAMERYFYRKFFAGKGDVWRLLQDLSDAIDGRTWPGVSEPQVRHVLALVHTVTGAKLNAFFKYDEDDTSTYTARGKRYEHGLPWQRMNGPGHVFRRWIIRLMVYLWPKRTDYTAAEALEFLKPADKLTFPILSSMRGRWHKISEASDPLE